MRVLSIGAWISELWRIGVSAIRANGLLAVRAFGAHENVVEGRGNLSRGQSEVVACQESDGFRCPYED